MMKQVPTGRACIISSACEIQSSVHLRAHSRTPLHFRLGSQGFVSAARGRGPCLLIDASVRALRLSSDGVCCEAVWALTRTWLGHQATNAGKGAPICVSLHPLALPRAVATSVRAVCLSLGPGLVVVIAISLRSGAIEGAWIPRVCW